MNVVRPWHGLPTVAAPVQARLDGVEQLGLVESVPGQGLEMRLSLKVPSSHNYSTIL